MGDRPWVKLWDGWYTSASHQLVGHDALHVGVVLMTLVRWEPGADDAWAVLESGKPMPTRAIAVRAQMPARRAELGLQRLVEAGTVMRRADGAWGFVKFGRWQETADAARKRQARPRKSAGMSNGTRTLFAADIPREAEAEGEAEAEQLAPLADARVREAEQVIAQIVGHRARLQLSVLTSRERDPKHILARLEDGVPLDELLEVVDLRAREAERDPNEAGWLVATAPFSGPNPNGKSGGWAVSRAKLDRARAQNGRTSARVADEAEYQAAVARRRAEARGGST